MQFIFSHPAVTMIGFVVVTGLIGRVLKSHPQVSNALGMLFAIGFLLAFAVAFGGAGIFFAVQAGHHHDWKTACFSIPFIVIGGAFATALLLGGPAMIKSNRVKAAHPGKPWLWESDWASGQIPDHNIGGAVGGWVIAAMWNGISIPAAMGAMQQYSHTHDSKLLIVLIFPAVGLGFFYNAIRATARAAVYGKSIFSIDTLPASPGGTLVGTVRIPKLLQPTGPVRIHLVCTRQDRSQGSKNTTSRTVWEDEKQLDRLPSSNSGSTIPVYFSLPQDVPVCTAGSARSEITWRLEVSAPAAEVNYRSKFKIPVFPSGNPIVLPPPVAFASLPEHEVEPEPADLRGITLTRLADGGCTLHFAAGRNLGMGIVISICGAVLTVAAVLVTRSDAPLGAEIIIWFLAAIFDLVAVNSLLAYAIVTARPHSLDVQRGILLWLSRQSIPAESVSRIDMEVSGQAGNSTVYYRLKASAGEKTIPLASGIRGKATAQYLAGEIEKSLGIPSSARDAAAAASDF